MTFNKPTIYFPSTTDYKFCYDKLKGTLVIPHNPRVKLLKIIDSLTPKAREDVIGDLEEALSLFGYRYEGSDYVVYKEANRCKQYITRIPKELQCMLIGLMYPQLEYLYPLTLFKQTTDTLTWFASKVKVTLDVFTMDEFEGTQLVLNHFHQGTFNIMWDDKLYTIEDEVELTNKLYYVVNQQVGTYILTRGSLFKTYERWLPKPRPESQVMMMGDYLDHYDDEKSKLPYQEYLTELRDTYTVEVEGDNRIVHTPCGCLEVRLDLTTDNRFIITTEAIQLPETLTDIFAESVLNLYPKSTVSERLVLLTCPHGTTNPKYFWENPLLAFR